MRDAGEFYLVTTYAKGRIYAEDLRRIGRRGHVTTLDARRCDALAQSLVALHEPGAVASMSRAGDGWDNAVAESFFATLKAELVEHERYATRAAAVASIGDYIDNFHNVARRHSCLGYLKMSTEPGQDQPRLAAVQ